MQTDILYVKLLVIRCEIFSLIGKPVAFTTLRMLNSACELESAWTEVDLDEIVLKIVNFLYLNTCQTAVGGYDEHLFSQTAKNHLSAAGFSFCFPLMQHLLLTRTSNMILLEQILTIISEHLDIREVDQTSEKVRFIFICYLCFVCITFFINVLNVGFLSFYIK